MKLLFLMGVCLSAGLAGILGRAWNMPMYQNGIVMVLGIAAGFMLAKMGAYDD